MSVRVEKIGNKLIVETDYSGSDVDHSLIQRDRELIGAMAFCGINKLEGSKRCGIVSPSLRDDFDRQYKEKTGKKHGYFSF